MSESPESPNPQPPSDNRRLWLVLLSRVSIAVLALLLLSLAGALWWGWRFVRQQLAPTLEAELREIVNRPVEVGAVEGFGLSSLEFGRSGVPATEYDPSYVSVEAIEVQFDPWEIVWNRTLHPDITLVEPEVYLEQNENGDWTTIELELPEPDAEPVVSIELDRIQFEDAIVTLQPRSFPEKETVAKNASKPVGANGVRPANENNDDRPDTENNNIVTDTDNNNDRPEEIVAISPPEPVKFNRVRGSAEFLNKGDRVKFALAGNSVDRGRLETEGEAIVNPDLKVNAVVRANNLQGSDIGPLLNQTPVNLTAGNFSSNIQIEYEAEKTPSLQGAAQFENVTAKLAGVPQPIIGATGQVRFQEQLVAIEQVEASYGKIPVVVPQGLVHLEKGYEIPIGVPEVDLELILETLEIASPVEIAGEVEAVLKLAGPLDNPILAGEAQTTQLTTIDRLPFDTIQTRFGFQPSTGLVEIERIMATPAVGGEVQAVAKMQLGQAETPPQVVAEFIAAGLSGNAIADLYQLNLPLNLSLGNLEARGRIGGTTEDLEIQTQWQATGGSFPASGELVFANETWLLQNTQIAVPGGRIQAEAALVGPQWQARLAGENVSPAVILPPELVRGLGLGAATFQAQLAGPVDIASPADIQGQAIVAVPVAGGVVETRIGLSGGQWQLQAAGENANLGAVLSSQLRQGLGLGPATFQVEATGAIDAISPENIQVAGIVAAPVAGGVAEVRGQLVSGGWEARVAVDRVNPQPFLPPSVAGRLPVGPVVGQFNVAGQFGANTLADLFAEGRVAVPVAGGGVEANVSLDRGVWEADLDRVIFPVAGLVPPALDPTPLEGTGYISGTVDRANNFTINTARGDFETYLRDRLNRVAVRLSGDSWQANVTQLNVPLSPFLPGDFPNVAVGDLVGDVVLSGSVSQFSLDNINADADVYTTVAGGTIDIDGQLVSGLWNADVDADNIQLKPFDPQLRGELTGDFDVAGTYPIALNKLQVSGDLLLSQGASVVPGPLTASVAWNGGALQLEEVRAPGLLASGEVFPASTKTGLGIGGFDLEVALEGYNLKTLPVELPENVAVSGEVDFSGRVVGTPDRPNAFGELELRNLVANGVEFDPVLAGGVQFVTNTELADAEEDIISGLVLELQGENDAIGVALDENFLPVQLAVQIDEAIIQGETAGDYFNIAVREFPLTLLNLPIPEELGLPLPPTPETNRLSGNAAIDFEDLIASGTLLLDNPALSTIAADALQVENFYYEDGQLALDNAVLQEGESLYQFSGAIENLETDPLVVGRVAIDEGKIQHVLEALRWFEIEDIGRTDRKTYGTAEDLDLDSDSEPPMRLYNQLRRFAEIQLLLEQQEMDREEASPLPSLGALQGTFDGAIDLAAAAGGAIDADFDLEGNNWQWDEYTSDRLNVVGEYSNEILTIARSGVTANLDGESNTVAAFSGQIGGENQNGELRIDNLPIAFLEEFVDLSAVDVTGNLNTILTLAGSVANPQARGRIDLVGGTLSREPIDAGLASFNYNNGRLNLAGSVSVEGPNPIVFQGSIPYDLPGSTVTADSNEFDFNLAVEDEGLSVINFLNNTVAWRDGVGKINLKIAGQRIQASGKTLYRPTQTSGVAIVENGVFTSPNLPEPLTNVNGRIVLDGNNIIVEGVQGEFERGQAIASGVLPLFDPFYAQFLGLDIGDNPASENPLQVRLDDVELNLRGLYRGGIAGQVAITGSALDPLIGGEIRLYDGEILLPDPEAVGEPTIEPAPEGAIVPEFNDLHLILEPGTEIVSPPILQFLVHGDLIVNGTLENLLPEGVIELDRGRVNVFTTEFYLVRGERHTATFLPETGTDPNLKVRLQTAVQEVSRQRLGDRRSSEISDPALDTGGVETVRIFATVKGPASQLTDRLSLESSPPRSPAEIRALLGGGFVNTLGRGDSTLAIANLAGSALLSQVQAVIGRALGLSEFRLFPTINSRTSSLGLGAEGSINITDDFSFSILQVITEDEDPAQFGLRYRLDDNFLLRGSTNFDDDSRVIIEFNERF